MLDTIPKRESLIKAIDIAGGMQSLAKKIGVSYQTILNWKSGRTNLPAIKAIKIEQSIDSQVTRQDILPDYPWEDLR